MNMRNLLPLLVVCAWSVVGAAAPDATGRWKVTISAANSTLVGVAFLKQLGDEVTGSVGVNEQNQHPLDGAVNGNRIVLRTHPRPGRTVAFAKCELTLDGDTMSGTTEGGDIGGSAKIEFVREKG